MENGQMNIFDMLMPSESKSPKVEQTKMKSPKKPTTEKVIFPLEVVAASWKVSLADLNGEREATLAELVTFLAKEGYDEVTMDSVFLEYKSNYVFVCFNGSFAKEDAVVFDENETVCLVQGQRKMELTPDDFDGIDKEDITIKDLSARWARTYPSFEGSQIYFDFTRGIGYPVLSKAVLQCKFAAEVSSVCVQLEDEKTVVLSSNKNVSELLPLAFDEIVSEELPKAKWYTNEEGSLYIPVFITSINEQDKGEFTVNKSVKKEVKSKTETFILPFTVIFSHAADMSLTKELFSGKDKITVEELRQYIFHLFEEYTTEKAEFIYFKTSNIVEARIKSSKRGGELRAYYIS